MKTVKKITVLLMSSLFFLVGAGEGMAQVVTPSLDVTQPILMPSAAAWSRAPSAGFSYHESSGSRDLNGKEIYEYKGSSVQGRINLGFENFALDAGFESAERSVNATQLFDGVTPIRSTDVIASLALLGNDFTTIGLGIRQHDETMHIYDSTLVPIVETETVSNQEAMLGSMSFMVADNFYLGGGIAKVSEKSDLFVENDWMETTYGAAMWFGQGTKSQFRFEISMTQSPESIKEERFVDGQFQPANFHYAKTETHISMDVMMKGLVFSFTNTEYTVDQQITNQETGEPINELTGSHTEASVLWIPPDGLILGFGYVADEFTADYTDKTSAFKVKGGYMF